MIAFLKVAGRWGGVLTIIALLIVLLRQLISLVGLLFVAIKIAVVAAFLGLIGLMIFLVWRSRCERKRDAEQ